MTPTIRAKHATLREAIRRFNQRRNQIENDLNMETSRLDAGKRETVT